MPFYQSGLSDRLFEVTFAPYDKVIHAKGDPASYKIEDIYLEFDRVTDANLASAHSTRILYERVHRQNMVKVKKSDTTVPTVGITEHAKSLKGILLLFQEPPTPYAHDTETFHNPQISKVKVCINGVPNQLYDHGLHPYQQWDEARKYFGAGPGKRHPEAAMVLKDLHLAAVQLGEFLTDKHALWLDLRT